MRKDFVIVMFLISLFGCKFFPKQKKAEESVIINEKQLTEYYFKYLLEQNEGFSNRYYQYLGNNVESVIMKFVDYENNTEIFCDSVRFDNKMRIISASIYQEDLRLWKKYVDISYTDTSMYINNLVDNRKILCLLENSNWIKLVEERGKKQDTTFLFIDTSLRMLFYTHKNLKPFEGDTSGTRFLHFDNFGNCDKRGDVSLARNSEYKFNTDCEWKYSPEGFLLERYIHGDLNDKYEHDKFGNVILSKTNNRDIYFQYEFDEKGNWVTKNMFVKKNNILDTIGVDHRRIKYVK
jgi:hypothetical protein